MGLRDQSWCSSCGQGIMYTVDENSICGECAQDSPNKLINLIEYIRIHLISLEQDLDNALMGEGYNELKSQISVLNHILDYAQDLTNPLTKE